MNNNTKFLFKTAVMQLHSEKYTVEHAEFPLKVWKRYQALDNAQKFVSEMVSGRYTEKHSEDKLATGFRK
jgi:hypothetical protein